MKLRWLVYTVGTRDISELKSAIPELEIVYDRHRDIVDTFRLALKEIGTDPAVLLEDDITLCSDFKNRVTAEINQRPNNVISFFSGARPYTESQYVKGISFAWNQCVYHPPMFAAGLLRFSYLWNKHHNYLTGTDSCLGAFLQYHKQPYYIVVPNLVQHLDYVSLVNPKRSSKRQSPNFAG